MGTRVVNGQRVTVPTAEMTTIQAEWTAEDAETTTRARKEMVCSLIQAKAALDAAGLLTAADTAVAAAGGITALAWSEANELERLSPTVTALQATLGLSDTATDDLFTAAMAIKL